MGKLVQPASLGWSSHASASGAERLFDGMFAMPLIRN